MIRKLLSVVFIPVSYLLLASTVVAFILIRTCDNPTTRPSVQQLVHDVFESKYVDRLLFLVSGFACLTLLFFGVSVLLHWCGVW